MTEIKKSPEPKNTGQIVFEYLILLVVAVSIGLLMRRYLVGDENTALAIFWRGLLDTIANDVPL